MFGKQFQIVTDDSGLLTDVSKGDSKNRAHFGKKVAELVENETKIVDWDFVLFLKYCVDIPKVLKDIVEIEFIRFFHVGFVFDL